MTPPPAESAPTAFTAFEEASRLLEFEEMKSLFSDHLSSDLGKGALASLCPAPDVAEIRERLELGREVAEVLGRGTRIPLGGCHDLGPLLANVRERGRPLEAEELGTVAETLECARNLVVALELAARDHPDLAMPRLAALATEVPGFTFLTDRIEEIVDERRRVRSEASSKLAEIRAGVGRARDRMQKRLAALLEQKDFKNCLQEPQARFRSGRAVVPVKAERRGEIRGILHDFSQSGATCFVEPEELVADGNALEDLLAQERREITRILWGITIKVLDAERNVREALRAMARIDLAVACARTATEWGLAYPGISKEGVQRFRRARHPILLRLMGAESVVPVDLRIGEDFFLLVITGPNTGGKTVALKTLGLLVLMAQSGLPVPAEDPEFSPVRELFVDIGDEQSLQQSLSTFSSHMGRIGRFLASAGRETLVLLDELGAGTDPAEGAALGRAVLDFLHARRVPAVITTHLGNLKSYAFTHEGASNASVEFDVETLSPTYRLLIGQPGASNAITIAERLGLPAEVVEVARSLVTPADRASLEILEQAQRIRTQAERHLRYAEDAKSDSRDLRRRAEDELKEAEGKRELVEKEAEDEMEAALGRLRRLVMEYGKELAQAPKPFGARARELLQRAEEEIRATPLIKRREEFALTLCRGDEVYVPKLRERFQVHAVRKKDRLLVLSRGSLRVEVPFADVTWVG